MTNSPVTSDKPRRGRPRTGKALSDAERARRYRERKKLVIDAEPSRKSEQATLAELRQQLEYAQNEISALRAQLALFVTKHTESGERWTIQERKGNARWRTVEKGLPRSKAEEKLDKLAASVGTSRYSYRMIEE
ncbi:hypothetical protein FHC77_00010 [Atlantibacter hermannii]|mgnify:CR=1 FL=1|uniref:hypothetical protein n=1 Tax=Atlantibacter hermannii TaxID=565 RepID=UPI001C708C39|nr:hypothetical protein [Atlantibacter hermannii]MBW9429149.1 hypothetical protein [Atlantibacter hermannii]